MKLSDALTLANIYRIQAIAEANRVIVKGGK